MPPQNLYFKSWQRSPVYDLVPNENLEDGRLVGNLALTLRNDNSPDVGHGNIPFHITAPRDITGIRPQVMIRTAPPNLARDAETTKLVHVDFCDPDFPWRYTPRKAAGDVLRPWLVVLVGTPAELRLDGQFLAVDDNAMLSAHDLNGSHLWAHVQNDGAQDTARLISPRKLAPQTEYLAALVSAFDDAGQPAWDLAAGRRPAALPLFYSWRFWTAEEGDFETLALAIVPRQVGSLGVAPLTYQRGEVSVDLEVRGAITRLGNDPYGPPEAQARADLAAFKGAVDDLSNQDPLGRHVIGLPTYGSPWVADSNTTLWTQTLNQDPRFRGTTGLGLWMGIEAQDNLVDAAAQQLGAIELAAHLVRGLALGLEASRALWGKRLPEAPENRLFTFSPLMRRMLAIQGTAMQRITGPESPLEAELFSSAARRMLRRGSAWMRYAKNGGITRRELVQQANQCPPAPEKTLPGLPHIDGVAEGLGLRPPEDEAVLKMPPIPPIVQEVIDRMVGMVIDFENPEFRNLLDRLSEAILQAHEGCELHTMYLQRFQGDLATCELLVHAVRLCLGNNGWEASQPTPIELEASPREVRDFLVTLLPDAPYRRCAPPDVGFVVDVIGKALDPNGPTPPAWRRVQRRITGIDIGDLTPPEVPVGLDFPTWTLLRDKAREWLLPNIDKLEKDSVVAMQTNPTFIDAYLVGVNTQLMNEMHWRNLPVDRSSTPLLMFWGHVNFETQQREADIKPLSQWAPQTDLGDLEHQVLQPGDLTGKRDLVIVFRTDLFRRYPSTLVYLVKPGADVDADLKATPVFEFSAAGRATRKFFGPIFQGNITPEVVFFAFDIDPGDLDKVWLVLDEPPSELRFRSVDENGNLIPLTASHAAALANKTLDQPTRVAIDGAYLKTLGLSLQ